MDTTKRKSLNLPESNGTAPNGAGSRMWRSLDELAQTPEFVEMVHREFPDSASEWDDASSRRTFLKVMGASLALAGIGGCVRPVTEKIVPYVRQPEEMTPGRPLFFASSMTFRGYARGVLVESHEGRPTKIEGNPDHPASLGSCDAITHAEILNLYDPDRAQVVKYAGEVSDWTSFNHAISAELADQSKHPRGQGIRILTGTITSPTLAEQISTLITKYPAVRWHQYEPVNNDNQKIGLKQAFGVMVEPIYHFEKAKVIVSLDDNFLMDHAGSIRYAREFINGRRVRHDNRNMNVLHVAESAPSVVGAMADYRTRVKPSEVLNIARGIAAGVGVANVQASSATSSPFVQRVVKDLQANQGSVLVVAGDGQPAEVHSLAAAINSKLGSIGTTVDFIDPVEAVPQIHNDSLKALVDDMNAGKVDVLIIMGGNPVYDTPADVKFADAMQKVNVRVHHGIYYNETSFQCHWHLPATHDLEAWSDARAYDGTAGVIQPLIAPLYLGKSAHELLTILVGEPDRLGYEIVQGYWQKAHNAPGFDQAWVKWLNNGVVDDTAFKTRSVTLAANPIGTPAAANAGELEIIFRPDPQIWDGKYTNNGWLMEAPRPLTRMTWDNLVMMNPATAQKIGVATPDDYRSHTDVDVVKLSLDGREVNGPIWIMPDHPLDCVTVYLGYGRTRCGRVGDNAGFDAYTIRTLANSWSAPGLKITKTGDTYRLSCVQNHALMDQHNRDLIRVLPINGQPANENTEENSEVRKVPLTLYQPWPYIEDVQKGNKWGMVIDQNACIGCNACVVACQSENNIAVVGKEQVGKGREMHWLRIDHYYVGDPDTDVQVEGPFFQPLLCMQCETAPCELVCPVGATNHDIEGINDMVYNRCVGTRYCSNNCPYKVRHFNFLHFTKEWVTHDSMKMMENPNVTVRSRGVMEKCTYCIQRIDAARIDAKKEVVQGLRTQEGLRDGEVLTACQQSCPTQAIIFGNINDPTSQVTKLKTNEPENYILLEELQTRPRTSYLPRYVNRA